MSPEGLLGFEGVESLISGANRSISAALAAKPRAVAPTSPMVTGGFLFDFLPKCGLRPSGGSAGLQAREKDAFEFLALAMARWKQPRDKRPEAASSIEAT